MAKQWLRIRGIGLRSAFLSGLVIVATCAIVMNSLSMIDWARFHVDAEVAAKLSYFGAMVALTIGEAVAGGMFFLLVAFVYNVFASIVPIRIHVELQDTSASPATSRNVGKTVEL